MAAPLTCSGNVGCWHSKAKVLSKAEYQIWAGSNFLEIKAKVAMERRERTSAAKLLQHSLMRHLPLMLTPNPVEGKPAKQSCTRQPQMPSQSPKSSRSGLQSTFQWVCEWPQNLRRRRHKTTVEIYQPEESLQLLDCSNRDKMINLYFQCHCKAQI
jgi:hypothetical protein